MKQQSETRTITFTDNELIVVAAACALYGDKVISNDDNSKSRQIAQYILRNIIEILKENPPNYDA